MRLNAIMALATVAGVVGVMGSAAVGSLSVRHHYFMGAGQGGSAHHSVPVEITYQLTGADEPAPMAFMLLSNLVLQPAWNDQGRQRQSDPVSALGYDPMTSQFIESSFGGDGVGNLAAGQGAASASTIVQNGLPNTSQLPDSPPSAGPAPGGAPFFGGAGFVTPPSPPGGPGPPPIVNPPISGPPVVPPPIPPLLPPPLVSVIGGPQQDGGSPGTPATSAIPEPATWFLLVLGLGLTGVVMPGRRYGRPRRRPPSSA